MTNKEKVEIFKKEKIAVNCETEEEAKSFIKWCFDNGMEWKTYNSTVTHFNRRNSESCYSFGFTEGNYLGYSYKQFYKEEGYEIIKYKDFMEKKKMTRLEYVASKDLIKDGSMLCRIAHICKYGNLCHGKTCPDCEFNHDVNLCVKTLLQEHKEPIKLKQWEYDLLNAKRENYGNHYFGYHSDLRNMKNKGYFKDVADTSMPVAYILDNCEVVKDE